MGWTVVKPNTRICVYLFHYSCKFCMLQLNLWLQVSKEWSLYWDCVWHKICCLAEGYTNPRYQVTLGWHPISGVPQCGTCLMSVFWQLELEVAPRFLEKVCSTDLAVHLPHLHDITQINKEWKAVRQEQQTYINVISVLPKPFLCSCSSFNVYICSIIFLWTMRMTNNYNNQQMHTTIVQYTTPPDKKHTNTHHID